MMRPLCLLFLLLLSWTLCRGQAGVSNLVCTFSDGCSCYLFTQRENRVRVEFYVSIIIEIDIIKLLFRNLRPTNAIQRLPTEPW